MLHFRATPTESEPSEAARQPHTSRLFVTFLLSALTVDDATKAWVLPVFEFV